MQRKVNFLKLLNNSSVTSKTHKFERNAILIRQGEDVKHLGVVLVGRVRLQTFTDDGQLLWLKDIQAGDFFGFNFLRQSPIAQYETIASTDVKVQFLTKLDVYKMISSSEPAFEYFFNALAARSEYFIQRLTEATTLTAYGRICAELKRHSKPIGINPSQFIIRPTPVFSDFALRVGSTRESVSRTVTDLTKKGIILRQTGALVIDNMPNLEAHIR